MSGLRPRTGEAAPAAASRAGPATPLAACLCLLLSAPVGAQELGGRIVRGTDSSGVAGAVVELHRITGAGGSVVDSVRAGPSGSFRFDLAAAADDSTIWLAAARHQGTRYFGPPVHAGGVADPYLVAVWDTAMVAGPADLPVGIRHLVAVPAPGGGFDVAEIVDVAGRSDRTVTAAPGVPTWSAALPAGAERPGVMEGGLPPGEVSFADGRVAILSAVPPTGVRLAFRYALPEGETALAVEHPTRRLELLVSGGGVQVEAGGLTAREASDVAGTPVRRFTGSALEPGDRIRVRLELAAPPGRRWAWAFAGLGLLLVGAAVATWRLGARSA